VFENRVFRRLFEPKRERRHGSGENYIMMSLVVFTSSSDIFQVIKSRRMRWMGRVVYMGDKTGV